MLVFKKIIRAVPYILSAAVLFLALYFDKQAFLKRQTDFENRAGYPPAVSDTAPDFTLTSIADGGEVSSAELLKKGDGLFVFTSVSCPHTQKFMGELTALAEAQSKDSQNIHLIFDTGAQPIDKYETEQIAQKYPSVQIFADKNSAAAWGFKLNAYPTQYIISSDNTIRYRQIGYAGAEYTKRIFNRLSK